MIDACVINANARDNWTRWTSSLRIIAHARPAAAAAARNGGGGKHRPGGHMNGGRTVPERQVLCVRIKCQYVHIYVNELRICVCVFKYQ